MTASTRWPRHLLLLLGILLLATRCAEAPRPDQPAVRHGAPTPTPLSAKPPAPAMGALEAAPATGADGKPLVFNDPPAPPDTPLCGRQAQESNAIGAGLQGARVSASGICARFACYDPLTATYIGADGYRHVCR